MAIKLKFTLILHLLHLSHSLWAQSLSDFDWTSIQPSDGLNWTPCYSSFQCARFNVPIDYNTPQGAKAAIAIIRLPAKVSSTDPTYAGPVFFNPGGPGGSGISFLLSEADTFQSTLGPIVNNYDLVSFDPRGVGFSTPSVSFLLSDADRSVWDFSANAGDVNSSTPSLEIPRLWARSQALGYLAEARDNGIFAYVTTDNVARDMWGMVKAFNWAEMQYYGLSYGTVLGATFATLFPDKIGRMVLDGVGNPQTYFSDDWASALVTTDKDLQDFFDSCHNAGPQSCPFYRSTSSQISDRYTNLLASIRKQPVVVHSNSSFGIVDEATVRGVVLDTLYNPYPGYSLLYDPYPGYSSLALALVASEQGDGYPIFQLAGGPPLGQCSADSTSNFLDASVAISCGDGIVRGSSAEDLIEYYERNIGISSFLNEFLIDRVICTGWRLHRNDTFRGPVGANTSFPILLIGNTADPVTPLAGALNVSSVFPRSVVLTQDSPGHTSLAAPSSCTVEHIIEYFVNGTLPSKGTVCPIDSPPFNTTSRTTVPVKVAENIPARRFMRRRTVF